MSEHKYLEVFSITPEGRGDGKDLWSRVGTFFPSPSGDGGNIVLECLPLPRIATKGKRTGQIECRLVVQVPKPRDEVPF